jgi:hypothetical protein
MQMTKIYRSGVRAAVYEAMQRLYAAGLIDEDSMHGFDELCLTPIAAKYADSNRTMATGADVAPPKAVNIAERAAVDIPPRLRALQYR